MGRMIFEDRREAGRQLGLALEGRRYGMQALLVLGIPRGGLVVAEEVAYVLDAPMDVIIARKLRAPSQPELAIGAVVAGGHVPIIHEEVARLTGANPGYLEREIAYQKEQIDRRLKFYRGDRPPPEVAQKTVIVVDDGIATGYTFRAALESLRRRSPLRLVAAAPVAARDSFEMLEAFADDVVSLHTPDDFVAVGAWYRNFDPVSDEEALSVLRHSWIRSKAV